MNRRRRGDEGVTTLVIVFPVLLTIVMLVFQFALYFHAQQIVTAAAEDATRAAQREGGSEGVAQAVAAQLLADQAPTLVQNPDIDVDLGAAEVRAEVRGTVARLVPFVDLEVAAIETGPRERFIPRP